MLTLIEFTIENIAEKIHNGKTKDYFTEVLSSYNNGNFRSAVVMLWSVAVCDIVYKLQNLVDLYNDVVAKRILDEITKAQTQDPKSSIWEIKLLDDVFKDTHLIDSAEYENLRFLQKQRHLSAHPVLNQLRELHSPNKETVRALLRNTLEGLLIKPPFYTQKIFNELLEDLAENSHALNSRKKVKRYLESRYLNRLTNDVELSIFKSLWKLVFRVVDEKCDKHRILNLQVLEVISKRKVANLANLIAGDKDYFSNIAPSGNPLAYLVFFIASNPSIYDLFNEDAKLKIQHCIDTDKVGKTMGWFIKTNFEKHFDDLQKWVTGPEHPVFSEGQLDVLLSISDTDEWQECFCKLISTYYAASKNFNEADERFTNAIEVYLHLFNANSLKFMLENIEPNNQTYGRGRAGKDHALIKNRFVELLGTQFDYKPYPNFFISLPNGIGGLSSIN